MLQFTYRSIKSSIKTKKQYIYFLCLLDCRSRLLNKLTKPNLFYLILLIFSFTNKSAADAEVK